MTIRQGLLALLADGPRHGYQLRADFESRTGGTWPLNIGQVYTTLQRLERDGLVASNGRTTAADRGDRADRADRVVYELTGAGRHELADWWTTPVRPEARPRDELAIKLALAVMAPDVDVHRVVQAQRTDTLRALQEYTRLKVRADDRGDLAWLLVLDSLVFAAEAEVRWLDHCEARLARKAAENRESPGKSRRSSKVQATDAAEQVAR
jgi:DNA-binding PadR family transcriptional regulator